MLFRNKKKMEFIQSYIPTSKAQLVQVAMWYHKGDIGKAQEMVDFYTKNLDLPDFDPIAPTLIQQVKGGVSELYTWIKENQNELVNGYQLVQSLVRNRIPETGEPLPSINE